MDKIKVIALGGLDENGRDCYVVEINDDIFVLDCGTSLPDKNIPGVDFVLPNVEYLINNKNRVKAYLMTHGHDEQMAGLKYFYEYAPAPIYCTNATKENILGQAEMQDVKTDKMQFCTKKATDHFEVAGHKITFFQTCHNMAYSVGICIETDRGNIVYTGDFIVDYDISDPAYIFDFQELCKISEKPTLLLMAESKSANKEGYCAPRHRVTPRIEKAFKDEDKRIFICCFWQNFFRIKEICKLVKQYHKKIYFYDDYTRDVMKVLFKADPTLYDDKDIVPSTELLRVKSTDLVILMLGKGKDLYDNINALAAGDNDDKRMILGKDDIFCSAAVATPTLETSATRSVDNLYRTGCEVIWVSGKEVTAMHARHDDLKFFLTVLKPKYYLPIRGNFTNLMDNAKLAISVGVGLTHNNIFIMDNGDEIDFIDERPRLTYNSSNGIDVSPVLVDGKGISKVADMVISDRMKLGEDGAVVVAACLSNKEKRIVAGPDCQMRGFVYVKEAEPLLKSISEIFINEIELEFKLDNPNFDACKERICDRAKRFIRKENGREPYILPIMTFVD